jgi:hypothetical protein
MIALKRKRKREKGEREKREGVCGSHSSSHIYSSHAFITTQLHKMLNKREGEESGDLCLISLDLTLEMNDMTMMTIMIVR